MKVPVSLIMLLVVIVLVDYLAESWAGQAAAQTTTLLHVGLLMLGGWLAGLVMDRVGLPHISGYLLFGMLVGPFVISIVAESEITDLGFANDLAVALIALTAGGEIHLNWLRDKWARLLAVISVDVVVILAGGIGVFLLAKPLIPFIADESWTTALGVAMLAGTVMIANSPTVVIAMVSEARASGPLTQMTLAFTVLKDMVLIILFATVTSFVRAMLDDQASLNASFLLAVAVQLVGSIGLGALLGIVMAWYVARIGVHLIFFIIGACMLFAIIGEQSFPVFGQDVHFEPLLMALSAGLLCQNLWPRRSEPLFESIEEMSLPVYCLFFALAGAKIDLGAFAAMWYLVIGLVAVRVVLVWAGVTGGCRLAGIRDDWAGYLWLGMVPQAGVTVVLITLIGRSFDGTFGWGVELSSLLLGMLMLHELLGPIGFRHALVRSGEARAGPEGAAPTPGGSRGKPA